MPQVFMSFTYKGHNYTIEKPKKGKQFIKHYETDKAVYKIKGNTLIAAAFLQVSYAVKRGLANVNKGYFIQKETGDSINTILANFFTGMLNLIEETNDITALAKSLDQSTFPDKIDIIRQIYKNLSRHGEKQRSFIDGLSAEVCQSLIGYFPGDNDSETNSSCDDRRSKRSLTRAEQGVLAASSNPDEDCYAVPVLLQFQSSDQKIGSTATVQRTDDSSKHRFAPS